MNHHASRWMAIILLLCCLPLMGCNHAPEAAAAEETGPAKVEHLDGAEPTKVTLTEEAATRLDIQTEVAKDEMVRGSMRRTIPYAAILYDTEGNTWTYTNPEPFVYMRHRVVVDFIDGEMAVLTEGPAPGTKIVVIGAEELFGSELEFEEE
jgi:hypothetical protein